MHDRFHGVNKLHYRNTTGSGFRAFGVERGSNSSSMSDNTNYSGSEGSVPLLAQQHLAGPEEEPNSSFGEGLDGINTGNLEDPVKTAARTLLGGMATTNNNGQCHSNSSSSSGNSHSEGRRGADAEQQQARWGGSAWKDQQHQHSRKPSDSKSSSNKGHHDEDRSLMTGVAALLTRTRRQMNFRLSTLARQQRERSIRLSSTSEQLVPIANAASEGADLSGVGGSELFHGDIHRSQSSVFERICPFDDGRPSSEGRIERARETSTAAADVELVTMEAGGGDIGDKGDVLRQAGLLSEEVGDDVPLLLVCKKTELLSEKAGGYDLPLLLVCKKTGDEGEGAGGDRALALSSLRRAGRVRHTTGDLTRLCREEEQGAGEDSAQEDRDSLISEAANGSQGHKGSSMWWGVRSRKTSSPQLVGRKAKVEQWKRDQMADQNFKVLGVKIGHLQESQQFFICAGGVFLFLLVYGYMQEYLVVGIFDRKLGLFLTLLQFFGYATCATLRRGLHGEGDRKIPLSTYFCLGFLQACMQGLTNVSMMYLNYPAKVLFKSSRMVPIMVFGVVWQNRKYSTRDYIVVFLIVTGLATFMNAETRASENLDTPFSFLGVGCIVLALVVDAAIINIQEELMNRYNSCQDELIMFSYLCGTVFVVTANILTGDLRKGIIFLHHEGLCAVLAVMLFASAGFLGVSCVGALTKRFGALPSAITTTARKAVTLLLSFVVFPNKPFSLQHGIGSAVFIFGLVTKATGKKGKSSVATGPSSSISPLVTPYIQGRKHLKGGCIENDLEDPEAFETSNSAAPLLSGGSGGPSCNGGGHGAKTSGGDVDRTHSPSPVGQEGSATVTANPGGYPVRHRGSIGSSASFGNTEGGIVAGREGHWGRQRTSESPPSRSPRPLPRPQQPSMPRGVQSPPVTGLGSRIPE